MGSFLGAGDNARQCNLGVRDKSVFGGLALGFEGFDRAYMWKWNAILLRDYGA